MKTLKPLLKLAREAIQTKLDSRDLKVSQELKESFSEKLACFVTLTIASELRGCIGSLEARQELWKDVIENARNAAFSDPRFPELTSEEFKRIKIEVSILSPLKKIDYKTLNELKKKTDKKGVLIKKGYYSATYLPQVWEEISSFEDFISSLCMKAGLARDSWKNLSLEVYTYEVEKIKE